MPAGTDAGKDPAGGEQIEGCPRLGDDHRIAVGEHQDRGAEFDPICRSGHQRQRDERIDCGGVEGDGESAVRVIVLGGRGEDHVVAGPDRGEAEPLGSRPRDQDRFSGGEWTEVG